MKINFKTYFLYMFSTVLIVGMLYDLICIFYAVQYIVGGIKQFDQDLLNKTFPYFIMKVVLKLKIISIKLLFFL